MRKFIAFGPAMVVLITVLATLVAAPAAVRLVGYANTDVQVQLARHELETENVLKQIDRAVRAVADAVEPSVVHIGVEEIGGGYQKIATGSGWVFDKQGHIVTNSHVVHDATRITVQFNDGRAADAEVVGQDTESDIAVLKVSSTEGLFPAQRGTGVELHQGDRVFAFGSPFGFKFSMSEGIVSGLGRDPRSIMPNSDGFTNFIQTDAAVNPGNSGGPLVNVEGRLVGMNVAIATSMPQMQTRRGVLVPQEGQNSGISFAIPLATIDRVVEQLISGGTVARGSLGIYRPSDDDENQGLLDELKYHGRGVAVTGVEPNSPAAKSGMHKSDVITKLNGSPVTGVPELRSAIANFAPGDQVKVEVSRAGDILSFEVQLGRLVTRTEKSEASVVAQRFGIADVGETSDGHLLLREVLVPSPAYNAGLRPNIRILNVNGTAVHTIDELYIALASPAMQRSTDLTLSVELAGGKRKDLKLTAD